ncbi:MAG: DMT family transporter [Geminicoccaceae bacterium]
MSTAGPAAPVVAPPLSAPNLAVLLMLLAMFSGAMMDTVTKILSQTYAVPQILLFRFLAFTAFGLWLARGRPLGSLLMTAGPRFQIARGLVFVVEMFVFVLAVRSLPLATVHAVIAVSPLLVVLLSVPLLGERVGIWRMSAILAGFIGVLIIIRPGTAAFTPVMFLPLAGAVLWALYSIMTRMGGRAAQIEAMVIYMGLVGTVCMAVLAPFVWTWPDPEGWTLLALVCLLGTLTHYVLIRAYQYADASSLQPFAYSIFVFAVVLGYFFFDHLPDAWTWLGAGIAMAAGLIAWWRERRQIGRFTAAAG